MAFPEAAGPRGDGLPRAPTCKRSGKMGRTCELCPSPLFKHPVIVKHEVAGEGALCVCVCVQCVCHVKDFQAGSCAVCLLAEI